MSQPNEPSTAPSIPSAIDPLQRVSEVVFGTLMAMSIIGTISVATAGRQDIWAMTVAAIGCNLAWGFVDGVMFLISTWVERRRHAALIRFLQADGPRADAHQRIKDALPDPLTGLAKPELMDALHQHLRHLDPPATGWSKSEIITALRICSWVVLATFPIVVPFLLIPNVGIALRASNALALITLFISGQSLGRQAGGNPWHYGVAMTAVGVALVAIIIALGG